MGDDGTEPWKRREGETPKAHAAFLVYLELGYGHRSIDKAWRAHQKSAGKATPNGARAHGTWTKWSTSNEWVSRADAYDTHELAGIMAARERTIDRAVGRWVDKVDELLDAASEDALTVGVDIESADPALVRERRASREYILGTLGISPKARGEARKAAGDAGAGERTITVTLDF